MIVLIKSTGVIIWVINWNAHTVLMANNFYWKRLLTNYGSSYVFPKKWMKWDCCFKENNWQFVLSMTNVIFSCENYNFRKLVSNPTPLHSQYLKIFLMISGGISTNVVLLCCIIGINIWKICTIKRTNTFQVPNRQWYIIMYV